MTSLVHLLSPNFMHALGWTLLHFLWQGTAIAAFAAFAMMLCRRASARYVVAVVALVVMFAAPIATCSYLLQSERVAAPAPVVNTTSPVLTPHALVTRVTSFVPASSAPDQMSWLVEIWLFGVACLSFRWAGGLLLVERARRRVSEQVAEPLLELCLTLQGRLGVTRTIRYCQCAWLDAPAVMGWFRPVVLLPITAISGLSEEQLRSIIAHELAHIRRYDAFVNAFQVGVETLLFYHPAIWWLNRSIRDEREHCCDDVAVSLCGNAVEYARALTLMEEWRSAPALAMAANRGSLSNRIFHVLRLPSAPARTRSLGFASGIVCLATAVIAANVLFGLSYPKLQARAASLAPQGSSHVLNLFGAASGQARPASKPAPAPKPSAGSTQSTQQTPQSGSYIDGMKAAGLDNLTADELIAMKIQGVTPDYVRGIHAEGLKPDADNLVAMRIQGVTPEYIHEMRGLGFTPDVDQLVAMKIQGIDGAFVNGMKDAGVQADADQLVAMKIQGVTPDYVRDVHKLGLQADADNLVAMRIQGVSADYIRGIQALGLKPDVDQLVAMRIQGVTPEYVKGIQSAGIKFDIDDLISAKIQQITPEFIERAMKHGLRDLTLEKLIELKHAGVLDSQADL